VNGSGTVLDTTANNSIYAGYSNYNGATLVNPNFPLLDNQAGYSISFNLQMLAESRANPDRAGFSIIVTSNDATKAIELGFQRTSSTTGKIFAQSPTFTTDENIAYNTNIATDYTLQVAGDAYKLFANGTELLADTLRDYSGFSGPIDPYETPNFLFLGDDTTSAQGRFNLSQIVVQIDTRVRFVPNPNYNGVANINFRAWDTTNGLANGVLGVNASVNGGGTAYSAATSTASITINLVNDVPTGNVTIDGTAQENQTLTVNAVSLSDGDGLGAFSYQWQSGDGSFWTDIAGAIDSSFTPSALQVGRLIRVRLAYTDQQGTPETVDSAPTMVIAGDSGNNPPPVLPPVDNRGDGNPNPNQPDSGKQNDLNRDVLPSDAVIIATEGAIRENSTNQVTIRFSEAVSNVDLSDLVLLRDGSPISLTDATLTTTDNITWTLSNLASLTAANGRYQLTLKQSNITDLAGNRLIADVSTAWLVGRTGVPLPPIKFNNGKSLGLRRLGGKANDRLIGTPFNDWIISGFGEAQFGIDRLAGGEGNDRLISGRGNDILSGGDNNDWIKAGKGNDLLQGGDGSDQLMGNAGQDVIVGGAGNDRLTGSSGGDTFVYRSLTDGTDIITDFEDADLLDLRLIFAQPKFSGTNAFARFIEFVKIEAIGADVKISMNGNGDNTRQELVTIAVLKNTALTEIDANNFLIA
jgi:Ca2+-binding RTX toxin-like protein